MVRGTHPTRLERVANSPVACDFLALGYNGLYEALRITDIVWKERIIRKLAEKHGVSSMEVEEVLLSGPLVRKAEKGRVKGQDVYAALAQIGNGRRLIVFFIDKKHGMALPISARDMDRSERKYYDRHK